MTDTLRGAWLKALRQSVVFPLRAMRKGVRLPPGSLSSRQSEIDTDQRFFLKRASKLGPIFKLTMNDSYTTCVVGHERGARLVSAHNEHLPGLTIDLNELFPKGALRGMSGDLHNRYRRLFLRAVQGTPLSAHADAVASDIACSLQALAASPSPLAGDDLRDPLRRLTTRIMLRFLFGLDSRSPEFGELEETYRRFGPEAPVYVIEREHAEAFARISSVLRRLAENLQKGTPAPPSFLRNMVESGELDETALGNLAYMFEPSHFDLYSLWHWILRYLGAHPEVARGYRDRAEHAERTAYSEAIVQETLRMEQSELLYRRVTADIVFEGFLIPRDTLLRVCIWEGHKDADAFPDPFAFDPGRFVGRNHGLATYAPFGLGQRHCLGAHLVVGLSTMFVTTLLESYDVRIQGDGPPHRGAYHWQPNPEMAVQLTARDGS